MVQTSVHRLKEAKINRNYSYHIQEDGYQSVQTQKRCFINEDILSIYSRVAARFSYDNSRSETRVNIIRIVDPDKEMVEYLMSDVGQLLKKFDISYICIIPDRII